MSKKAKPEPNNHGIYSFLLDLSLAAKFRENPNSYIRRECLIALKRNRKSPHAYLLQKLIDSSDPASGLIATAEFYRALRDGELQP